VADVVPSIYQTRPVGRGKAGRPFGNLALRPGEVKRVTWPEDPDSRTRRWVEYDVLVQHQDEDGSGGARMYHNVVHAASLGGPADDHFYALRTPDQQVPGQEAQILEVGNGSKVLMLCINGAESQAVILAALRDQRGSDKGRSGRGVHWDWVYNGARVLISDDGGVKLTRGGPTDAGGDARGDTSTAGASVELAADGSISAGTGNGEASWKLDQQGQSALLAAQSQATVDAPTIRLGKSAVDAIPLGTTQQVQERLLHAAFLRFLPILATYAATIQPIADPSGSATGTLMGGVTDLLTAIGVYEGQAATYLSTSVTVQK